MVDHRNIEPPVFRYRMTAEAVVLRLDFNRLSDAAAFRKDFAAVLGLNADADRTERHAACRWEGSDNQEENPGVAAQA